MDHVSSLFQKYTTDSDGKILPTPWEKKSEIGKITFFTKLLGVRAEKNYTIWKMLTPSSSLRCALDPLKSKNVKNVRIFQEVVYFLR